MVAFRGHAFENDRRPYDHAFQHDFLLVKEAGGVDVTQRFLRKSFLSAKGLQRQLELIGPVKLKGLDGRYEGTGVVECKMPFVDDPAEWLSFPIGHH